MTGVFRLLLSGLVAALFSLSVQAELPVAEVERATLQETLRLDGAVEAVQRSTVSAQTSGRVMRLPFDVDDRVAAGELIVQLEDSEQRARRDQAKANLEDAQAGLQDARQRFERVRTLQARDLISREEFDQARNTLTSAQARVERAEAALAEAREQLGYTRVLAPYDGILTERHVEVGEAVSPGQPLLTGLSLERLRVVVDLPQRYADLARAQRQARVTLTDGRILKTGEMTFYPYASKQTHTFRLRLALPAPGEGLYPGMLVKVDVPVATREALWIPAGAVFHHSELTAVFVLDDDRPRLRQIRTGIERDGRLEVLAGLDEGERVATSPDALFGSERLTVVGEESGQ
ncbi:efflux RND transporter periplasmic adaptor subunit [Halomonas sp. GXIMD04776]|uniref:efflux RND transporter periplasmic adaptor subunit n=1 Tax=Halomonas sp. GXIMD04776 TaxID=3415605 RepID=UPI003CB42A3A